MTVNVTFSPSLTVNARVTEQEIMEVLHAHTDELAQAVRQIIEGHLERQRRTAFN